MMEYDGDSHIPHNYLVTPPAIDRTVSEYLCANGNHLVLRCPRLKSLGTSPISGTATARVISTKISKPILKFLPTRFSSDTAPKMKALEITEETLKLLKSGKFRFGRINLANGDMVGHTGKPEAIITAVQTVDECLGRLIKEVQAQNGIVVVTADHGNADEMFTVKKGARTVSTAHSLNAVPFAIVDPSWHGEYKMAGIKQAGLANVAADAPQPARIPGARRLRTLAHQLCCSAKIGSVV